MSEFKLSQAIPVDGASDMGSKAHNLALLLQEFRGRVDWDLPKGSLIHNLLLIQVCKSTAAHFIELDNLVESIKKDLGDCPAGLIVRSSARGEDSHHASFAGQLLSKHCDTTPDGLKKAILECFHFHETRSLEAYEEKMGRKLGELNLLVQEFVDCQFSGVLFSHDPMEPSYTRVEYCTGSCNKLVSGEINPGIVKFLRKRKKSPIKPFTQSSFAGKQIPDVLLEQLAQLGLQLEDFFSCPVDIEWGSTAEGKLYVFQCRPITSPAPAVREQVSNDDREFLFSNSNMCENYPTKVIPLLHSIAQEGYTFYFRNMGELFGVSSTTLKNSDRFLRSVLGVHQGHLFYNLSSIYHCFEQLALPSLIRQYWNGFLGVKEASEAPSSENPTKRFKLISLSAFSLFKFLSFGSVSALLATYRLKRFESRSVALAKLTLRAKDPGDFLDVFTEFRSMRTFGWKDACMGDAMTMFSVGVLRAVLSRLGVVKDQDLADTAIRDMILTDQLSDVSHLASTAHLAPLKEITLHMEADKDLQDLFFNSQLSDTELYVRLQEGPSFHSFYKKISAYIETWGFRVSGEMMLTEKTWIEAPELFIRELRSQLENSRYKLKLRGKNPSPAQNQNSQKTDLPYRFTHPWLASLILWPLKRAARISIRSRERARLQQSRLYGCLRLATLGLGKDLAKKQVLCSEDDIFFLTMDEIQGLYNGSCLFPETLKAICQLRRSSYEKCPESIQVGRLALQPLSFMTETSLSNSIPSTNREPTCLHTLISSLRGAVGDEAILPLHGDCFANARNDEVLPKYLDRLEFRGQGVSPGLAEGKVFVAHSLAAAKDVPSGSILVARSTDPGWTSLLGRLSGLVLENGGMLCHGAIIAREMGIPCVTGVERACQTFQTGMLLKIDGRLGHVHPLEELH
ncbi:MAG: hypothetical protein KA436_08115 [Oligoflexales bacterium]|nr:hypothetical protein [Oligoflexales bacterium]